MKIIKKDNLRRDDLLQKAEIMRKQAKLEEGNAEKTSDSKDEDEDSEENSAMLENSNNKELTN